jgi:hypothetical protein
MMKHLLTLAFVFLCNVMLFAQFESPVTTLGGSGMTAKFETNATTVTLTLTGPENNYLAVGFGGTTMSTVNDAFIWNSTPDRDYTMSGSQTGPSPDAATSQHWTIVSDNVAAGTRTVVATRDLTTPGDYAFTNAAGSSSIIYATTTSTTLTYHGPGPTRGRVTITLSPIACNATSLPLPTTTATVTQNIVAGNNYSNDNCTTLLTGINSTAMGTDIAGSTTSTVWIEATQPSAVGSQFVKRHYEITLAANAATATGRVTLYFTQAEFDDFNTVSTIDLPIGSSDASGKANLLIEKRAGVSSDGTGLPGSYTGAVVTIDPADVDIVWNSAANRWEVSFDVTGFSGFFVKTIGGSLSLPLVNFTVAKQNNYNVLAWQIAANANIKYIEVERSATGRTFNTLSNIAITTGTNTYNYTDNNAYNELVFYRLKIVDNAGNINYSNIIRVSNNNTASVVVYPNLIKTTATLQVLDASLIGGMATITNATGKTLQRIKITANQQLIDMSHYASGIYILNLSNGKSFKLIKQ